MQEVVDITCVCAENSAGLPLGKKADSSNGGSCTQDEEVP